jgi:hypothetical protein
MYLEGRVIPVLSVQAGIIGVEKVYRQQGFQIIQALEVLHEGVR